MGFSGRTGKNRQLSLTVAFGGLILGTDFLPAVGAVIDCETGRSAPARMISIP
jgi:hypothetical protein